MKLSDIALYIHIPYCVQKCYYCDFASYANSEATIDVYIEALENELIELTKVAPEISARTIFIGGGTPTVLNANQLQRLFKILYKYINLEHAIEFTIEANPGTITVDKLAVLKSNKINRISLGVQSFQEQELQALGRIHNVNTVYETIALLKANGFNNINLDLMYGLPHQTIESWMNTLKAAISLKPTHISMYNLKIEEHTSFYQQYDRGTLLLPDEDEVISMYQLGRDTLSNNGYLHYEISNFSKDNYQSEHNLVYWNNHNYLGLGSSAWSNIANIRYHNPLPIAKYIDLYKSKRANTKKKISWHNYLMAKQDVQINSLQNQIEDHIMLGLRKVEGISVDDFNKRFYTDFDELYCKQLKILIHKQLLEKSNSKYRLTNKGLLLANEAIEAFFK
ncbi:radical SAM family heme chaperone HemW [Desulfuribacillus alkaliarsenatis]|uniref:Heme chaperone HemW n=1 Tax=Desulfuribacillus alkaliarsenatis TaxID=766136 RepID=A0A1E5G096_9FIRM|nr:radical SAM family heme chaperone HemW [Desulfuribacillus alkaliarsenatis]OEF96242.1 hypothetical protein BHF68_08750 [Desulfuribacillus alkaliarsenatis]